MQIQKGGEVRSPSFIYQQTGFLYKYIFLTSVQPRELTQYLNWDVNQQKFC